MFVVKEFNSKNLFNNKLEKVIAIGVKNSNSNVYPSPLSNFIKKEYRNKGNSLNSQRNAAYTITGLLNFLFERVNTGHYPTLKDFGLNALTLQMAADYITGLSWRNKAGELSKNYIDNKIIYINKFYLWLKKEQIITDNFLINYTNKTFNNISLSSINLFETNDVDIVLPTNSTYKHLHLKDFGEDREQLVLKFLKVAQREEPLLTLGIALQIFCGLRRSEVVNLMEYDFEWRTNNLIIKVRDHKDILFSHLKNTSDVEVKTPGDQICFFTGILKHFYDCHLEILRDAKVRKHKGLFINLNSGKAYSGKSYSKKFDNIKQKFLELLLEENDMKNYYLLVNNKWSTHIGRGIYTNILNNIGLSPTQIALARRDKNIHSSEAYRDEYMLMVNMNIAVNNLHLMKQFNKGFTQ